MNGSEASGKVKLVNVRQVFHDKNPHLAALLPGFVYRYLERIAHQREINEFWPNTATNTDLILHGLP